MTGKPVILVLGQKGGQDLLLDRTFHERYTDGILSGKRKPKLVVADVLFGDYNPMVYCHFPTKAQHGRNGNSYDRKPTEDVREVFNDNNVHTGYLPLYPFGWALVIQLLVWRHTAEFGYTQQNGSINVNINIANTGQRDGKHTVELYTHDLFASITQTCNACAHLRR